MAFSNWQDVARLLREQTRTVTAKQAAIGKACRVPLKPRTPARVAAVQLRIAMADSLFEPESPPPTDTQLAYLRDLAAQVDRRAPGGVPSRALAEAWIDVFLSQRALRSLQRLKPRPGDLVAPTDGPDTAVDEVISLNRDGRVNFRGGRGAGARPHRLRIVARKDAQGVDAKRASETAANRRALRTRLSGPPTEQRLAALIPFAVRDGATTSDVSRLRDIVEDARDERPIQQLLAERPGLLAGLSANSFGAFLKPLPRLGAEYVPDFVLAIADSAGIHYTLVELESPRARLSLNNGQFAAKAREAIAQIEGWREWLKNNLAYAQRSPDDDGLGLPEIRPESPGLILIGRREHAVALSRISRQRARENQQLLIHTYDWLIEVSNPARRASDILGPLYPHLEADTGDLFSDDLDSLLSEAPFD